MRILVADDHALLAESLRMMLELDKDIEVVGVAYNGLQAVKLCEEQKPDVVLMDLRMPVMDGVTATKQVKSKCPDTKVIILTSLEDDQWVADCFASGADSYLLKDTPPDKLTTLIRCVNWGYAVLNPLVLRSMLTQSSTGENNQQNMVIRDDDLKMIRLVSEGKSNSEIAEIMSFAEGTVKNRITKVIELVGVENRAQLVMYALRNNLI
ncbi:MAG: response regulator transcription factor [Thermoclostridium sp.]|nr:response regulator transcription factor [Thermoclostridium sp.]